MPDQQIEVSVDDRIARPIAEVFEAIVEPAKMAGYFISRGSGRMTAGERVEWEFGDVGAKLVVGVIEVNEQRIVFDWDASGSTARVTIRLAWEAGATRLEITESGWPMTEQGVKRALGQTQGWTNFLCCLKAFVQHGINLRA
jgi:uncharacterized protein YndB with AHSA1/START domain